MVPLHERLRWLRKSCGFTLADLAERTGLSVSFLSDIERGRSMPSLENLERIADACELSIGEVLVNVRIRRDA